MELRQLRCFEILAEELHFARAADRLGTTQSGVSRLIAGLETALGGKLFNRAKRSSVSLTATGALFLPEARAILRQAERGETIGRRAARGEIGGLEIGFVASAAWGGVVSSLVRRYRAVAPGVEVRLREMETPRQLEEIAAGRLDLGFLRARADYPVEVKVTPLQRDALHIALPEDHKLAAQAALRPADLKGAKFIVPYFGEAAGFLARIRMLGEAGGFTPEILAPVRDFLTVLTAVAAGLGVGLIPENAVNVRIPGTVLRPVEGVELISELMLASRRAEASPAVRQFLRLAGSRG
ncbi:LysR family transcriptional regulator [Acidocella sp. KAb 2-4]|uniref:LysR family transcriptional regulator n=1 Tax=Acidocella sp. KAb 2-4 TaxID=2885158 RepID=UPI001D08FA86|nr:LysR family transcriptional regulator [Acidocella sp. KAb 2-4]MCB5944764.1 LysR family transcriptional regulator [Acidocella sp. KAb 2-4]